MTSMINVLWCEYAVLTMASMAPIMRCNAESVPMVISVPQKSLSIEPTYERKISEILDMF